MSSIVHGQHGTNVRIYPAAADDDSALLIVENTVVKTEASVFLNVDQVDRLITILSVTKEALQRRQ